MPITTISAERLYRKIANQLTELVRSGEFKPGGRLPSERELSQQLGVSRASVREALIAMEIDGIVDIRVGTGIFINPTPGVSEHLSILSEPGPFEVLDARYLIEGETAALAAVHGSDADHQRIRETLQMMRDEFSSTECALNADSLFHLRLAEASGNSALLHLVHQLWGFRDNTMSRKLEEFFDTPERHAQAIVEHTRVLDAVETRQPELARAAIHAHLNKVRDALQRGWENANLPAGEKSSPTP